MPKRTRIRHDDAQNALRVIEQAIGEELANPVQPEREKDPLAVELGRRGGLKGGKARAEKLTARKLSAIGKKGAAARWKLKPS
jgi:hypothetical protein